MLAFKQIATLSILAYSSKCVCVCLCVCANARARACVRACVRSYLRACVCVFIHFNASLVNRKKTVGDKSANFFTIMLAIKTPCNDVFDDVLAHDIYLLFEGHRFVSRPFG